MQDATFIRGNQSSIGLSLAVYLRTHDCILPTYAPTYTHNKSCFHFAALMTLYMRNSPSQREREGERENSVPLFLDFTHFASFDSRFYLFASTYHTIELGSYQEYIHFNLLISQSCILRASIQRPNIFLLEVEQRTQSFTCFMCI